MEDTSKRLTAPERMLLEEMINQQSPLSAIAVTIGKHPTSITREVLRNRTKLAMVARSKFKRNPCAKSMDCKVTGLCGWKGCAKRCALCPQFYCHEKCSGFKAWTCMQVAAWPYVCNRCERYSTCPSQRYSYDGAKAQRMSDARASAARAGIDLAPQELVALDELVTPLVLQGQSLWHIWATHRDTIGVCPATLYNYLNAGLFGARRLNLPRAVRFRPRHTGKGQGQDRRDIGKRSYADYLALCAGVAKDLGLSCEYYHDGWDVEFDTVIGRPGGKCLFTIVFVTSELFLARLLDKKTQECAIAAFDWLEKVFRRHVERRVGQPAGRPWWFFNTALTDNGTEMKDFASFERSVFAKYDDPRCSVFYCDPYSSWQKPRIEVAHTLLRRVLPKGTSFEHLTQTDIDRVCSHINSYARENLMGAYPFEVAPTGFCGDGLYKALGLSVIAPDDINLTPGLLSR